VLMPRLGGREVLRRLRRARDWTPVVPFTQVGTVAERVLTLQEGADDVLDRQTRQARRTGKELALTPPPGLLPSPRGSPAPPVLREGQVQPL